MAGNPSGSVTNFTVFGEIPWADSSAATSKVPMLLTPFNPIFRPASWLIVAVREFPVTTARSPASRARVPGLHAGPDRGRLHPGSPVPA
jgi:hypothetical protein